MFQVLYNRHLLCLVLVGLSFAGTFGSGLERTISDSDRRFELLVVRIENLELNLRHERSRTSNLQKELLEMKNGYDFEDGTCACHVFLSKVDTLERGLSREKAGRRKMENVIESIKTMQFKWQDLELKPQQVHANLSKSEAFKVKTRNVEFDTLGNKEVTEMPTVCPVGFTRLKTGCYFFRTRSLRMTFDKAQKECKEMNSSLLSVETVIERDAIQEHLQAIHPGIQKYISSGFLTSGKRIAGQWKWARENNEHSDIPPQVLNNWARKQPDHGGQDCLSFWPHHNYQWADVYCGSYARQLICEREI